MSCFALSSTPHFALAEKPESFSTVQLAQTSHFSAALYRLPSSPPAVLGTFLAPPMLKRKYEPCTTNEVTGYM